LCVNYREERIKETVEIRGNSSRKGHDKKDRKLGTTPGTASKPRGHLLACSKVFGMDAWHRRFTCSGQRRV
jgi:hypothetical protein